jgi:hypothetical protein
MGQTTYERVVGNAPSGDYSSMTKAELVALAEARGLATSGTKAELVARLEEADAG